VERAHQLISLYKEAIEQAEPQGRFAHNYVAARILAYDREERQAGDPLFPCLIPNGAPILPVVTASLQDTTLIVNHNRLAAAIRCAGRHRTIGQ
jgi:hypothetical protein